MPFVSPQQRRACFAQQALARRAGLRPKWNCHAFAHDLKTSKRSGKTTKSKRTTRKPKIKTGPRGGKYIVVGRNKQKIYVK
jgi:hypothetical protein